MANYAVDSLQDGCYPGTVVLINILGIQNQSDLDAVEGTIVPAKAALWEEKPLAESFDFAHYCAIHRFLFEDLYEWAGKPRTVDISKKGTQFCPAAQIESTAKAIFARLKKQNFLVGLDRAHFISAIVDFYERTNELHPFREGNGRTQRVFLSQLAHHAGYVIDFANIKRNFEETNEAYLKELNRFNDPNEVGAGNETDTFKQVIEDPAELIKQMQEVQQVLFNYTTDNAEEFSSEISTIEDKQELLKLKKILIAARDCCNLVRTFGDDELKETFAKMELTKLPSLISEVQHHIDNINQKELFASDDTTKLLVNEAMEDITFNFSKISEEELKIVGGKDAVTEKYKKTVRAFTQNIDPDDPEFITLQEAFLLRFKQHGFEPKSVSEIEEQGKELEDILKKLDELQKKNTVLLRKYNGDAKFARVHKRIREENLARKAANKQPIVSEYDMSIMNVLLSIKSDIDQKVYDRNDILKKDAYFERTVMTQIKAGIDKLGVASAREDRVFIQSRITKQYLDQYNQTYSVA